MVNLPDYTQITLTDQNLLPLEDLGASAGYNRSLLLPDDLPGVIALPWAIGPTRPRVNQCQADGSLNVHVTGQSGGGGLTIAPIRPTGTIGGSSVIINRTGGKTILDPIDPTRLIAWIQISAACDPSVGLSPEVGYISFEFNSDVVGQFLTVGEIPVAQFGDPPNCMLGGSLLLAPPGGLDLSGIFAGATSVQLNGYCEGSGLDDATAAAVVCYLT